MLRQNSFTKTLYTQQGSNSPRALYDIESLRAAYQAVAEASATTSRITSSPNTKAFNSLQNKENAPSTQTTPSTAPSIQDKHAGQADSEFLFPTLNKTHKPAPFEPIPNTIPEPETKKPALLKNTKSIQLRMDDNDEILSDLTHPPESLLVKTLSAPKPVIFTIGLCLLTSSLFAGLGCWWLATSYASPADKPVTLASEEANNLMSVQEEGTSAAPVKKLSLKNIQTIQDQPAIKVPKEPSTEPDELSITGTDMQGTLLAQAAAPTQKTATAAPAVISTKTSIPELTGRPDPFAPLIQINGNLPSQPSTTTTTKKDVLEDLQYTGFIGSTNAKNKLAIIKVPNPAGGSNLTIIKKVGSVFLVEGERIVLKAITKQALQLSVEGQTRTLAMSPYQDAVASTSSTSGSSDQTAADSTSTSKTTGSSSTSAGNAQLQEP
jgi:hypothetical protein